MKLLLDQNISHRLVSQISRPYTDTVHVRDVGLTVATDDRLWQFAKEAGRAIVSKDTDFMARSLLYGHPPKVIYLRVGNCSTVAIRDLLVSQEMLVRQFTADPVESLLVLQ